ncbi:hypothetical protein BDV25DRAFT_134992 [Aspergillus avenaceus]|uniref:Uncharacterized protein n=1 Tax=Aspergillus avenaceus TaxID=36643 RepID=A0A5N6U9E7_ASPAV|nr:hypothetical protein BDV25DRAFT_134992 [Aspergillus avenaceus]
MTSSTYQARTPQEFKRVSEKYGGIELLTHLTERELTSPASRWGLRHLLGYRLLTLPERPFLDLIKSEHDNCPLCYPERACSQELDHGWAETLITKCPLDLSTWTDSELLRQPGGFFWVALARASRREEIPEPREYPQRERRPLERHGFVDSTESIVGSSPTNSSPTSSSFQVDPSEMSEDEHIAQRSKPEDVTVHLLISFVQFTLNLCLSNDPDAYAEVRPRIERRKSTVYVAGKHSISAEDDGGICRMDRQITQWRMGHPYLAIFEAKRAFKYLQFDDRTEQLKPVVSNETLAQYLGEALVTWISVFLIAATSTFIRFVHFKFGSQYREYIDAETRPEQMALVNDEDRDTFVYMHSTRWFNLQLAEGRRLALCHILALLRWHGEHGATLLVNADNEMHPESEDSYEDNESE